MHSSHPRFDEPLGRTLIRNLGIAVVVGAVFALRRHHLALLLPTAALALWFTLGGHLVEILFLNGVRNRIPPGRPTQIVVRLAMWLAGGTLLYLGMAATARAVPMAGLPLRLWWIGGFVLIGVELAAHAALVVRGQPNFYNGRG